MSKKIALVLAAIMLMSVLLIGCGDTANNDGGSDNARKVAPGVIAEGVYTNAFAGFSFTAPEGWEALPREDLSKQFGENPAVDENNAYVDSIDDVANIYDAMFTNSSTGSNMIVMYENLKVTNQGRKIGVADYLDILKKQLAENAQIKYEPGETADAKLGGTDYKVLTCKATAQGITMNQYYFVHAEGEYMIAVIYTALEGETVETIEAMFKAAA